MWVGDYFGSIQIEAVPIRNLEHMSFIFPIENLLTDQFIKELVNRKDLK